MKNKLRNLILACLLLLTFTLTTIAGNQGTIVIRPLGGNINITIDGQFDDWPLDAYEQLSEQPGYPLGENFVDEVVEVDARGDHIRFNADQVGSWSVLPIDIPAEDFAVDTYFAYDDNFMYVLAVYIDDSIQDAHPSANDGIRLAFNDGIEFFIDPKNDSEDFITSDNHPSIDTFPPYADDFQIITSLTFLWDSVIPEDQGGIGAVMGIERAGDPATFGEGDAKFFVGSFQDALEATEGPDIAALRYDDLRSAGAPNPAIADNPNTTFAGYALEMRFPFGFTADFTPDHTMSCLPFWRETDDEERAFVPWTQSSGGKGGGFASIWNAKSWASLEFNTDNPLGSAVSDVVEWSIY